MKPTKINCKYHPPDEKAFVCCANVCDFPLLTDDPKQVTLVDGGKQITAATEITIYFDYPISNPVEFKTQNPKGFTRLDLYRAIYAGYKTIYDAETDPGTVAPNMLNRAQSKGPYGIWGHYMEDLCIEGVEEVRPGYFRLLIGS